MAKYTKSPKVLPEDMLERYKYELAEDYGLLDRIRTVGFGDMTSRECGLTGGRIGGNITKVLIRRAEELLAQGANLPR